jgi:hypothetical protein
MRSCYLRLPRTFSRLAILFNGLADFSNQIRATECRFHQSPNVDSKRSTNQTGNVDVSNSFELIYDSITIVDRVRVSIESTLIRVSTFRDPSFRNAALITIFDRPNIISRTFGEQDQQLAAIHRHYLCPPTSPTLAVAVGVPSSDLR